MPKVITITANRAGFDRAADLLDIYAKRTLPKKVTELINRMCKEGEMTAKMLLMHVDTGETLSSIIGYREGDTGIILVGGKAVWIEFGTGVYAPGQVTYPKEYRDDGIVGHGEWGEKHGADPNGWYYKNEFGEWRHTYGIPANMFMYNTTQMLVRQYAQMAKEIFTK